MNDVSEGVSGLINEGNVGALVQNVTFGLSNSAAKVTGSLSEGLGRVTMDEKHEEIRQRLLRHTGQSSDHIVAGLKGLGFGILGGMTSIFTQTYEGSLHYANISPSMLRDDFLRRCRYRRFHWAFYWFRQRLGWHGYQTSCWYARFGHRCCLSCSRF